MPPSATSCSSDWSAYGLFRPFLGFHLSIELSPFIQESLHLLGVH